eukprot:294266_1
MMRDFETYVGPDFIQPGEERLLRSYQPAQPRVNRQPETEVLVAVKEIGKPLKIVQPGTAYLGRNAVHKLQQGDCCGGGGPAKADDADVQALGETIKAKEKEIERLKNDAKQEKVKTDAEIQDLKKDISTKEEEIDGLKTGPTQEKVKTDAKIQALEETIKAKEKEIQVLKTGVTQEKTNTDVKIQKLEKTIEVKDAKINELDETIDDLKVKEKRIQKLHAVHKLQQAGCCGCPENVGAELKDTKIQELNATIARLQAKCVDDEKKIQGGASCVHASTGSGSRGRRSGGWPGGSPADV